MKIVEIIPTLGQGGAERFVVDLCNEMVQRHQVTLIVLHSIDKFGLFVQDLDKRVQIICMNKKMGFDVQLIFRLYRLIKNLKPDMVHTHLRGIVYCPLAFMSLRYVKFIHTVHSDAKREAVGLMSRLCRRFAFRFKMVLPITISEESKRSFREFYHLGSILIENGRPDYVESHNNALVKEDLSFNEGAVKIVNVARLVQAKNQPVLVRAVDEINKQGRKVDLFIIGDVSDVEIKTEIESIGSKHTRLLGTKLNPRDYMAEADAFCLSSIYEGMPITLIECFSVGTIPICTPVGGIINMIQDGVNGIIAKGTKQEDIEQAIHRFLNMTDAEKNAMRKHSRESFQRYDMKSCSLRYEQLV